MDSLIAYRDGAAISAGAFIAHAQQLARALPARQRLLNLCEDRYFFLLAFAAALLRSQTTLLPPNRAHDTIERLCREYPDSTLLSDRPADYAGYDCFDCTIEWDGTSASAIPEIDAALECAILYTSGSSGEATPHPKSWGTLTSGAQLTGERLAIPGGTALLATVPPQHMFGLESSVLLPLQYGCSIDNRRPLFPADIATALGTLPAPRALITTPLQLRACASAQQRLPDSAFILSATAPLSAQLAQQVEALGNTRVTEIYGSTETGAIATRATASEDLWFPLPGIEITEQADESWQVRAPHLDAPQPLADRLQREGQRFALLGRSGDLIKVAGKRVSLGDLNHILLSIDGVRDGIFFLPQEELDGRTTRLSAAAVTDGLGETALIEALRRRIDAAFLPRPLVIVEKLPRNESGKLPLDQLKQLIRSHKRTE
ncbi:MAG: AMP-binding protein [Gammaproteobacteria bacterium]|nr:AMP-binding protein [Gammaproteobacteria bacterium]